MARGNRPVLVNGFMKMTRLGPPKVVKQKNNKRAPERYGMWAFPWPYYDEFFAAHRYSNHLPKEFRGNVPTDAKWFTKRNTDERIESLDGYTLNEFGSYDELQTRPEWWKERDKWLAANSSKVEKLTTFWYSGPIYTHINRNLEILWDELFGAHGERGEWDLTDTSDLYKRIGKSHGDRSGNPFETFRYSHDHLETFIPRGGRIRSVPR